VQLIVFSIFVVIGWVFVLRREMRRTSAQE